MGTQNKIKDPAFLFYSSDFLTGTILMSDEQTGRYIKLLCLQHQKGRLSKSDFFKIADETDIELISKFNIDENGLFYNERLENEAVKRSNYCASRRNNREKGVKHKKKISKSYVLHMENENINENINIIKDENKKRKYGNYKHVLLKDDELNKLVEQFGQNGVDNWIKVLDEGIELKGYKYKSHYLAILKWSKSKKTNKSCERTQPTLTEVEEYIRLTDDKK